MASENSSAAFGPVSAGSNPYLLENFRPVTEEVTKTGPFIIEGAIPPSLDGMVLRNGPNPASPVDPNTYHWFQGDGMVHAIALRDGAIHSYRNRLVRTRALSAAIGTKAPRGPREPINGPANTNVVRFANRILALCESGLPHRLTTGLDTVCVEDFDGALASPLTAHPKIDAESGRMAAFGYDPFGPPFLRYHEFDADGSLLTTTTIDLGRSVMIHDFAVSETKVAFFDLPVVFQADLAIAGSPIPYAFDDQGSGRVGVVLRGHAGDSITWFTIDPCFVFHVANAFDDGDCFVADVVVYDKTFDLGLGGLLGSSLPRLERWRLCPGEVRVNRTIIDDRALEFPVTDRAVQSRPYAHAFAAQLGRRDGLDRFPGYVKYDLKRQTSVRIDLPEHLQGSEPMFVRADDGRGDDEGYLLCVEYDRSRDQSDLVIYDAHEFRARPEARIQLPVRIPFGFHGTFLAGVHH